MISELILKIGDQQTASGLGFEDGDVICAFNSLVISRHHAHVLCHPWRAPITPERLLVGGTHVEAYHALTHQYRAERVSRHEMVRIDPVTEAEERFTGPEFDVRIGEREHRVYWPEIFQRVSNGAKTKDAAITLAAEQFGTVGRIDRAKRTVEVDGVPIEYSLKLLAKKTCHVDEFFRRRLLHRAPNGAPKLPIFGTLGRERIYTGRIDKSEARINAVWDSIEAHTERRRTEAAFQSYPHGRRSEKVHLYVPVVDFTEAERHEMESPWVDNTDPENPVVVKVRQIKGLWRDALASLGVSETDVLDRSKTIDCRSVEPFANENLLWHKREQRAARRLG